MSSGGAAGVSNCLGHVLCTYSDETLVADPGIRMICSTRHLSDILLLIAQVLIEGLAYCFVINFIFLIFVDGLPWLSLSLFQFVYGRCPSQGC